MKAPARPPRVGFFLALSLAYSRGVLKGVLQYVNHHPGWQLVRAPGSAGATILSTVRQLGLDAVIVAPLNAQDSAILQAAGVAGVNVSNQGDGSCFASVFSDDQAVGQLAADYLLDRGWRQFAYVGIGPYRFSQQRQIGFTRHLAQAGLSCEVFNDADPTTGSKLCDWLRALPTPCAIFTANDRRALNLVQTCRDLGLHVPRDIAVVGVDHDEVEAAMAGISLTSVELDTVQIGYRAAALLDRLLAGRAVRQNPVLIRPLRVVPGESSAANPVSDSRLRAVLDHITAHHSEPIYTADLCRIARLPRRMLERRFQEILGRSPNAHVLHVRVAQAKELLVTTSWPVERIAEACGFDPKKFALCFRSRTGLTPTQYRRSAHPV